MNRFYGWPALACGVLVGSLTAGAQITTARVTGTVTDASGAAVPNATLVAHNLKTGQDRSTTADGSGAFVFFSLSPAEYRFEATAPGFARIVLPNLQLQVGQEFTWAPKLTLAADNTTVTVDADSATALDTSSARIGGNVSPREVAELPLNGRQISQLYLLTPGATNAGSGTFDNIHFSGRATEQNIIRLDGIEATSIIDTSPGNLNGELTSTFRLQQSLEAVQEFRIDSSSYPAEMGTGTGGQISFVTKSGGNKVHGSAFEYLRNDYADARDYFNRASNVSNTKKFRLNQFGGSLGGPLMKDKLFFFASYEGLRQVKAVPYTASTLSQGARNSVAASSPVFPLLAAFPTDPTNTAAITSVQVTQTGQNRIQEDFGDIRLDYRINDRFSLYARYNRDQGVSNQVQDVSLSNFSQVEVPQNGVLALNQVLSSRMFNETKFGFNGIKMRVLGVAGPSPNADLSRSRIAVSGLTNIGSLISLSSSFNGVGAPYTGQSYSYIDNFSVSAGKHNMKFGVEVRPLGLYNNQIGGQTYTYSSITDFLNNNATQIQFYGDLSDKSPFTGLSGNAYVKQAYYIGYAQDEWKVLPNLTISYGMRYEYYSPLHEMRNKNVVFDMTAGTIYPAFAGDWYKSSKNNWGPRLGVTYAPELFHYKTVLRAGGGIFYGPGQTEDQIQPEANDRVSKTFGTTASTGKAYPINPATDVYAGYDINSPTLGYQPRAYGPGYAIPERVGTYTLSVEQELPLQSQFLIAYVGSVGRNLFQRSITNLITGVATNPTTGAAVLTRQFGNRFAEIDYKTSHGSDSYNGLQMALQKKAAHGLSLGVQYTFAHELGVSSGSNEATTAANPYDLKTEYGRGTFDIRHYLNATALYQIPFGKGMAHNLNGVYDALLGGWQLGGILNARTGLPIDVLITRPDVVYQGNAGSPYAGNVYTSPIVTAGVPQTTAIINVPGGGVSRNIRRPNRVAGVNPYYRGRIGSSFEYLNPAAFSIPTPGTFGNSRRNDYTGPGLTQLDLTLGKKFPLHERVNLDVKCEVFNILNHPNFANPGTVRLSQGLPTGTALAGTIQSGQAYPNPAAATGLNVSGTSFGTFSSTVSNTVGTGTNRDLQLSARINF